MQIISLTTC